MQNTVWCHPAVVTESSCYSFWQNTVVLNISAMELLGVNRTGYMCLLAIEGTQQLANWLVIPTWRTVQRYPIRKQEEIMNFIGTQDAI